MVKNESILRKEFAKNKKETVNENIDNILDELVESFKEVAASNPEEAEQFLKTSMEGLDLFKSKYQDEEPEEDDEEEVEEEETEETEEETEEEEMSLLARDFLAYKKAKEEKAKKEAKEVAEEEVEVEEEVETTEDTEAEEVVSTSKIQRLSDDDAEVIEVVDEIPFIEDKKSTNEKPSNNKKDKKQDEKSEKSSKKEEKPNKQIEDVFSKEKTLDTVDILPPITETSIAGNVSVTDITDKKIRDELYGVFSKVIPGINFEIKEASNGLYRLLTREPNTRYIWIDKNRVIKQAGVYIMVSVVKPGNKAGSIEFVNVKTHADIAKDWILNKNSINEFGIGDKDIIATLESERHLPEIVWKYVDLDDVNFPIGDDERFVSNITKLMNSDVLTGKAATPIKFKLKTYSKDGRFTLVSNPSVINPLTVMPSGAGPTIAASTDFTVYFDSLTRVKIAYKGKKVNISLK